jgi:hypothetical protein
MEQNVFNNSVETELLNEVIPTIDVLLFENEIVFHSKKSMHKIRAFLSV